VEFGLLLVIVALLVAMVLAIPGIGYLAVRHHFSDIPLNRWDAVAISSLVAAFLLAAWLTLIGIFGLVIGQSLGNGNVGSLIGGLVGIAGWIATAMVYGWRITRGLAQLQATMRGSRQPSGVESARGCLRVGVAAVLLVVAVLAAGALFAALNKTNGP
jgi:hypothetical protein